MTRRPSEDTPGTDSGAKALEERDTVIGKGLSLPDLRQRLEGLIANKRVNAVATPSRKELKENNGKPQASVPIMQGQVHLMIMGVMALSEAHEGKDGRFDLKITKFGLNEEAQTSLKTSELVSAVVVPSAKKGEEEESESVDEPFIALENVDLEKAISALKIMHKGGQMDFLHIGSYANRSDRSGIGGFQLTGWTDKTPSQVIQQVAYEARRRYGSKQSKYDIVLCRFGVDKIATLICTDGAPARFNR